jgi:hypothetical protein
MPSLISQELEGAIRMKTSLITVVLGMAVVAAGQQPSTTPQPAQPGTTAQQPGAAQPAQPAAAPQQKKEIKDPAEYNAYVSAVQQQDVTAKISGLEAFLVQYPNSVMKEDALELLMGSYQQAGNAAKMAESAQKLLQANPNNVRALALLAYTERTAIQAGQNPQQNIPLAKEHGQKGLQALQTFAKPEGMSDADFQKLKGQMAAIFNAAVGFAALQQKDYATAQTSLKAVVDGSPTDFSLVYPLALSYLQAEPPDYINGIWYAMRASVVATPQYQPQIEKYARSQYVKYHGGEDGWPQLLAQAKASPTPPAGFTIKPAPTPAEQAAALVQSKKPETMDFAEWQLILSEGGPQDAETVWNAIKGKALQFAAQVITATPTKLELAASVDDIEKKRADVELTMTATIPARLMPKPGTETQVEGTPVSYTPKPFLIVMENGTLLTKAAPAPTKKPPVRRRNQ